MSLESNSGSLNPIPTNLSIYFFSETQLIRLPLLRLRSPMPGEHHHPTLPDGPLLRRRVPQIWLECPQHIRRPPGKKNRPHGLRLSPSHQVHFPQIRSLRNNPETWLALHPAAQHSQREDLHLHLVLVLALDSFACWIADLPSGDHFCSHHQTETAPVVIQVAPNRNLSEHQQENWSRWLVDPLYLIFQHGLVGLQRPSPGAHQKNGRFHLPTSESLG